MSLPEINTIGAYDAKTRLSQLLERVEAGEEFIITRHGSPIARLLPIRPPSTEQSRSAVIEAMRQLASRHQLEGLRVKDLIAEGRK